MVETMRNIYACPTRTGSDAAGRLDADIWMVLQGRVDDDGFSQQ